MFTNHGIVNTIQQYDLAGITGWYMFNSNSPRDLSGNGYDLQIIKAGSDSPTADDTSLRISGNTAFNLGGAGDFAGTGLTNQSIINHGGFTYASAATFMGWAKCTDRTSNYQSPFGMVRNSDQIWRVYIPNDTFRPTAQRLSLAATDSVVYTTAISNNIWYHYAMTFNTSNNTMYFYVDGVLRGSDVLSVGNRNDSGTWNIWVNGLAVGFGQKYKESSNDAVHDRWKGSVDDVRFYAGRTFTSAEVTAVFNSTKRYYGK